MIRPVLMAALTSVPLMGGLSVSSSANGKLIPLNEVSMKTLDGVLYTMKRCAGLAFLLHSKLTASNEGRESPYALPSSCTFSTKTLDRHY